MIGVSLPFSELVSGRDLGSDRFLDDLFEQGVRNIELRPVPAEQDAQSVFVAATRVWRHGMQISVHTSPRSVTTAVCDVFAPLKEILKAQKQEKMILVLHPVSGTILFDDNRRMMETLAGVIDRDQNGAMLALENNRLMPDHSDGDSADFVMRVIEEAKPQYAGICFDFGHFAWATKSWEHPILPPERFSNRVIHTHIHALYATETGYTTHFPLQSGALPLEEYISAIRPNYRGVYQLELEPNRYEKLMDGRRGIFGSIEKLAAVL